MSIIVIDTETNGKPRDYKASMKEVDNWPRVIQLAWAVYEADGTLLQESCDLIKPDGWEVPKADFWIEHGYSTERNAAFGLPIKEVLGYFVAAIHSYNCTMVVAHNLAFDFNVLGAEMIRAGVRAGTKLAHFCTMERGKDVTKLRGAYGEYKWPKLEELHRKLMGKGFENAHDALVDVQACARCFFAMQHNGAFI